jgi:hypothetical protein
MQRQKIILIPPSEEQAYAVFHVAREFTAAFLAHLASRKIEVRDPPGHVGNLGPESQEVIEIELVDETLPISELEAVVNDFFAEKAVDND